MPTFFSLSSAKNTIEAAPAEPQLLSWKSWDSQILSALDVCPFLNSRGLAFSGIIKGIKTLKSVLNRTDNAAEYR